MNEKLLETFGIFIIVAAMTVIIGVPYLFKWDNINADMICFTLVIITVFMITMICFIPNKKR